MGYDWGESVHRHLSEAIFPEEAPPNRIQREGFVVIGPEFFNKLHLTFLEVEGLIFNVLLFLRFCRSEVKALWRYLTKQTASRARAKPVRSVN
jgi:hypothetical protein